MRTHQKHQQAKDTESRKVPDNLLSYPTNLQQTRQQFLIQHTPSQLKTITDAQRTKQFNLLWKPNINEKYLDMEKQENNRYCNIIAYKHSRVMVKEIDNYHINANQIRSLVDGSKYAIFSQAPYRDFASFWQAVYYHDINLILMLCSIEHHYYWSMAERYWPKLASTHKYEEQKLEITTIQQTQIMEQLYLTQIGIVGPQGQKKVRHIQWVGWKDLAKPTKFDYAIIQHMLLQCKSQLSNGRIPWIHCSAGIGRTGTFGALLDGTRYIQKQGKISVFKLVQNLRRYRMYAVETSQQYQFVYQYLSSYKL